MNRTLHVVSMTLILLLVAAPAPGAQHRPEVSTKPPAATVAPKPALLVIEVWPGAEVCLDDQYPGRLSGGGRLVIPNPGVGVHDLRMSLISKNDFQHKATVAPVQGLVVHAVREEVALSQKEVVPVPVDVRVNPKDGLKYVWIPPGTFVMGCSPADNECFVDETPSHRVTLSKGFWIGQTEVTVGAYRRFAAAAGRPMPPAPGFNSRWANDNMPIVNVSWNDGRDYCTWAGGRLPTEAEWEYAARGGSAAGRYGEVGEIAWYDKNSGGQTHEVAQKPANAFRLFDVLGNVWEWVNDWYEQNYYQNRPSEDPPGPTSGSRRVLRGGSWSYNSRSVRVSYRTRHDPDYWDDNLGLRCVRDVDSP
jgi:formylglycine-generating enzyme required for sulfatase activity